MSNLGNKDVMAKNITFYMEANGKKRNDVCSDLGFRYSTFTDWINGNTYPRIDKIEMLANYFRIEKSDLIEEKTEGRTEERGYYLNDETAKMAQEIFENNELRALFSASRKAKPEDLKLAHDMLLRMKRSENYED